VTLFGGLRDRTPEWGRADVTVRALSAGKVLAEKTFPNAPGLHGASFPLPAGAKEITFELTTRDQDRRNFMMDAVFSK
jgi:hypothetical protein